MAAFTTYMSAGVKTCQSVLCHQDTNDSDVGGACALAPTYSVYSGTIDEGLEHKVRRLVRRGRSENGNDKRRSSDCMPPYRDAINVLKKMNPECIN